MRYTFVHKALSNVAVGGRFRGGSAFSLGLSELPFAAVREQVVRISGTHDPGTGKRESNTRSVDSDPPATPLLSYVGGRPCATRGIEHQIARVARHQDATLYYGSCCLDNILWICRAFQLRPKVVPRNYWGVVPVFSGIQTPSSSA